MLSYLSLSPSPSPSANPSESSMRTLKLVAKAVQNLANLVEFKEQFMTILNPFICRHMPDMIKFINELSVGTAIYNELS